MGEWPKHERLLPPPKRLLFLRLDRIGDVALSVSAVIAARRVWPEAYLAMAVRKECRDVVAAHPALDAVLVYDKDGAHRSASGTWRFARQAAQHRFDTSLSLHPSNRSHWIPFLARIPVRVGYDRNLPVLLTHRLKHDKQLGECSEAAYALRMLEVFGINAGEPEHRLQVSPDAVARMRERLSSASIRNSSLVVVHPSASCPSKRWMPERFAAVADRLVNTQHAQVVLVAGPGEVAAANRVQQHMQQRAHNWAGALSIAELTALLQEARFLLTNDSGPMHLAAGVGTPVVALFGRAQAGLSPRRWAPLGEGHVILHKDVGCEVCLAHNCEIEFKCMTEIGTDEVERACLNILKRCE